MPRFLSPRNGSGHNHSTPSHFDFIKGGDMHMAKGDYDQAIIAYTQALQLNPTYFVTLQRRAKAHRLKSEWEAALCDINACIDLRPDFSTALDERTLIQKRDLTHTDTKTSMKARQRNTELESDEAARGGDFRVQGTPPTLPPKDDPVGANESVNDNSVYEEYRKKWETEQRRYHNIRARLHRGRRSGR